jgi:RNA polymerase sigma-70 factor (ECF subfamily)
MSNRMELTDATLVAQARAGDENGFRVLVERHSHALFRLAYRMTGHQQDAEDVVQETFLRAYRHLHKFDGRASFGSWLYRIASNCSLDVGRSRKRSRENDVEDAVLTAECHHPTPDRLALSGELRDRVNEAMQGLSATERTAFVLRHFEGLGIAEVSRALGCQTQAARHSVFRAVQKLRRALEPVASHAK